jgi:hypothetical protein
MQPPYDKQDNPHDISDAILSHVSNFAVGLVLRGHGKGSRVLGSGVLASIEGRRGILTCGHVAEAYEKLPEIGLIRFVAGGQQRRVINLGDTQTIIVQSSDTFAEKKEVLDLAFTLLPPDIASSIEAQGVFLNLEKNREKIEAPAPEKGGHVDAMLGLIAEFSEQPFIAGKEFISPMRAVLHTGHVCAQENGLLTVKAMEYNLHELPKSFGGMSGGGLWRIYFLEGENDAKIVAPVLCGIASWQIDATKIACQGWDRIDQMLLPEIQRNIKIY